MISEVGSGEKLDPPLTINVPNAISRGCSVMQRVFVVTWLSEVQDMVRDHFKNNPVSDNPKALVEHR